MSTLQRNTLIELAASILLAGVQLLPDILLLAAAVLMTVESIHEIRMPQQRMRGISVQTPSLLPQHLPAFQSPYGGPDLCGLPALIFADEAAAILASGIILLTAWKLAGPALSELLDADAPHLADTLRATAAGVPQVQCVEKVRVRKSGARWLAELHIQVDPELPMRVAHSVGGKVRAELRTTVPGIRDVLIHVEQHETQP